MIVENGETKKNLNTVMLALALGAIGAVGGMSWNASLQLAELKGGQISRQEIEGKLAEVKTKQTALEADFRIKQTSLETDLTALKLALAERGIGIREKAK